MTFLQYFIRKKTALSNTIFHTFSFQPETAHSVLSKRKIRKLCPDRPFAQILAEQSPDMTVTQICCNLPADDIRMLLECRVELITKLRSNLVADVDELAE